MSEVAKGTLWIYILVFCRMGASFILLPGISGLRVPVLVRLLLAIVLTGVITPFLFPNLQRAIGGAMPSAIAIFSELLIGLAFGFWCHLFVHASRFAANVISSTIGLAGIPGQPIESSEPSSHLATLLSLGATMLIFSTDLHLLSLAALVRSYDTMPVLTMPPSDWLATATVRLVGETSVVALQISGPLIVLSVTINLALGLCGKFTPQLQLYFASMGLTVLLSLMALAWLFPDMTQLPVQSYSSWLSESLL